MLSISPKSCPRSFYERFDTCRNTQLPNATCMFTAFSITAPITSRRNCGGNDTLQCLPVLGQRVTNVGEAMEVFYQVIEKFRLNYKEMLSSILTKNKNQTVCMIYKHVPDLSDQEKTALSVFNETIIEEAIQHELIVLDLRILCGRAEDYAAVSPIEQASLV